MLLTVDRYLIKEFFFFFFLILLGTYALTILVDFVNHIHIYEHADEKSILSYYLYYSPDALNHLFPWSCFFSTFFTFIRLNRSRELTFLLSSGMSLVRVSLPILVIVSLFSVFFMVLQFELMPSFMVQRRLAWDIGVKKKDLSQTVFAQRNRNFWYGANGVIFNIKKMQDSKAEGLSVYYLNSKGDLAQQLQARSAKIKTDRWELKDGWLIDFTEDTIPEKKFFKERDLVVDNFLESARLMALPTQYISSQELMGLVENLNQLGLDASKYELAYHKRWSGGLTFLVMVLLAIAFSRGWERSGGELRSIVLALFIALAYIFSINFLDGVVLRGLLSPVVGAWGGHIVTLTLAIYFFRRSPA